MVRVEHSGLPDANLQVLVMQVTTTGTISGQINFQVFPLGARLKSIGLGGGGWLHDAAATNYDETAQYDDGQRDARLATMMKPTTDACSSTMRRQLPDCLRRQPGRRSRATAITIL